MALSPYIKENLEKIANKSDYSFPQNIAMTAAWLMSNSKAINIKIFDTGKSSSLADYYIICSATNPMQASSLADTLSEALKSLGQKIISIEGQEDGEWVLLDFGDIIVHLFLENTREIFDLDNLWTTYSRVEIPEDFYFASRENDQDEHVIQKEEKDYF